MSGHTFGGSRLSFTHIGTRADFTTSLARPSSRVVPAMAASGAGTEDGYELGTVGSDAAAGNKAEGGESVVEKEAAEGKTCKLPHILNEFNALSVKHAKQRCRVGKGGCCGKCAVVCTLIEMLVPVALSLLLWLIYTLVDENTVGPVQMVQNAIEPNGGFNLYSRQAPNVDMPLALRIAGQRIAVVKGASASDADVTAFLTSIDKSFPGFNLATATGGACANEVWSPTLGTWQYAMSQDLPPYIDPPAALSDVVIPKFSDQIQKFASEGDLANHVTHLEYKHDLYAAIVLDEAGTAANDYNWRYTLRMHTFRGMGFYTDDGNSEDPLSPAPQAYESFDKFFAQAPWQTGIASTDGGDRSNERAARNDDDFERVPLPSYAALQIAVDRAIIDTTAAFKYSSVSYDEAALTAAATASTAATAAFLDSNAEQMLDTVMSGYFSGVLGFAPWRKVVYNKWTSRRRLLAHGPHYCHNNTALTTTQRASLATAYAELIWAGRGRVPHRVAATSFPGVEYLDPTFYDTLAFIVPIFYILIYLLPVFNQVRAEGALFYEPLYFTRIMLTIWLAPPNIFIYLSRSGARWRRRKRASRKACSSWA